MRGLLTFLLFGAVALAGPALAGEWTEQGDAPDMPPGQITVGSGGLTAIHGSITTNDADMYCINVLNTGSFVATTCGGTNMDTQLFTFDENGIGVSSDDDDPGGCGLQSTVTGRYMTATGHYLLTISTYDRDPDGPGGQIWADTPYNVERPPDGPGAPGPITGWEGSGSGGSYTIFLTSADFCESGVPVQESTWGQIKSVYK